jgi:peptidoglycan/xylan/chitin deacetylase (PgdA/CDA1 family)
MRVPSQFILPLLVLSINSSLAAQTHQVALTFDDLPFVADHDSLSTPSLVAKSAEAANRKLLKALTHHKVPVTGFVIQKRVGNLGLPSGEGILRKWTQGGLDLGNHTDSHFDFNDLTAEQYEDEIVRGEAAIVPVMKAVGRKPEFFRFPFNHTGDSKQKHDALAAFLAQRGYRLAPCTIENSDWMFNSSYVQMLARHDRASATRLRAEYLAFTSAQIDYFAGLNTQVLGHEPPEIMLLHDNQLNADVIEKLLALFEKKQYRWVSLAQAESDPVYQSPDSTITRYGPMWGYRWARERGVKVDGSREPEPPKWITDYGKDKPSPPRRPRSEF